MKPKRAQEIDTIINAGDGKRDIPREERTKITMEKVK